MSGQLQNIASQAKDISGAFRSLVSEVKDAFGTIMKAFQLISSIIIFILLLLVFAVLLLIGYVIYYMMKQAYPRIPSLGHTETGFDKYMENYFENMIKFINDQKEVPSCVEFIKFYNQTFNQGNDISTLDNFNIKNTLPLNILFMFYTDLKSQNKDKFGNLYDILKNRVQGSNLVLLNSYYGSENKIEINSDVWNNYLDLFEKFKKVRADVLSEANKIYASSITEPTTKPNILVLSTMLHNYFDGSESSQVTHDHIQRMYLMRRSGGFANFTLVQVYISDYWDYVFNQKIKQEIWLPFVDEAKTLADRVNKAMASDAVTGWFTSLPGKLAGTESFVAPNLLLSSAYANDVKEPFIDSLIKIAKTFVSLFEVISSILNIISDPLAFIRFLIGAVIAIVLYILYMILFMLQIATAIAYVYLVFAKVFVTVGWFALLGIFVAFYGALAILDIPLGGFIMRSLRCENLPDAWSRVSNWHNGNMYQRSLLCAPQCKEGFFPEPFLAICRVQEKDEPIFAPHQIIYNYFLNKHYLTSILSKKIRYSHVLDKKAYFANMDDEEKKSLWADVYEAQTSYMTTCKTGSTINSAYKDYDPLVQRLCTSFDEKKNDAQIIGLCQTLYCSEDSFAEVSFCKSFNKSPNFDQIKAEKNVLKFVILAIIFIIVLIIVLFYIFRKDQSIGAMIGTAFGSTASMFTKFLPKIEAFDKIAEGIKTFAPGIIDKINAFSPELAAKAQGIAGNLVNVVDGVKTGTVGDLAEKTINKQGNSFTSLPAMPKLPGFLSKSPFAGLTKGLPGLPDLTKGLPTGLSDLTKGLPTGLPDLTKGLPGLPDLTKGLPTGLSDLTKGLPTGLPDLTKGLPGLPELPKGLPAIPPLPAMPLAMPSLPAVPPLPNTPSPSP